MGKALQRAQGQRYRPKANGRRSGGIGAGGMGMQVGVASIGVANEESQQRPTSILEVNDVDDFLGQAALARQEFASQKQGLVVLDEVGQVYRPASTPKVQWADQPAVPEFTFTELSVPRRPPWDASTTPEELQRREEETFLEWRRGIAYKEEELLRQQQQLDSQPRQLHESSPTTTVTPFEKNLHVWRQLWRVLERSSCVVQLVDARNPLFYLSHDLKDYATTTLGKPMMVLVNKSDYLSPLQRRQWHRYLKQQGWHPVVFFSAAQEQAKLDADAQQKARQEQQQDRTKVIETMLQSEPAASPVSEDNQPAGDNEQDDDDDEEDDDELGESIDGMGVEVSLTRTQLLQAMGAFAKSHNCEPDARHHNRIPFGMVGFPNVGKSSVINVLMGSSKHTHGMVRVGVAAQPGKTKHFQTLLLPDAPELLLCDCPGLVFPSFVSNTADLIAAGVYPIAQMRDPWPVLDLICHRIPREILNAQYGIQLPVPVQHRDTDSPEEALSTKSPPPPTAQEFLQTLCHARGMMAASSGVPDYTRAARMVIQDYAKGKLLYCHAPPPPTTKQYDTNSQDEAAAASSNTHEDQTMLFYRETVRTALERTEKLRVKLEKQQEKQQKHKHQPSTSLDPKLSPDFGDSDQDEDDKHDNDEDDEPNEEDNDSELGVNDTTDSVIANAEESKDLIYVLAQGGVLTTGQQDPNMNQTKRNKGGGRKKKKKRRNGRDEDPYGCHTDNVGALMDSMILEDHGRDRPMGVTVKAGKYGGKGYTRPTGPGFSPAAATTTS